MEFLVANRLGLDSDLEGRSNAETGVEEAVVRTTFGTASLPR